MANAKTDIEHLNWLLTIFNQYGIYTDEINAISYAGIIAHTLTDSNAQITYKSNQAIKESHVITANKMDSLYKHAKEVEIMPTFSKPAAMKMILVISEKNFMMEAKGNGDIRYYTISKDNFVKVGNFIYSLDYDIELRLETLINGEKIATSRYVIDDVLTNPISIVDNTPSIRTIRVKTEDSWEYQLYVTLQQYHREFEEELNAKIRIVEHLYTQEDFLVSRFRENEQLLTLYYIAEILDETEFIILDPCIEKIDWISIDTTENPFPLPIDKIAFEKLKEKIL